MGQKSVSVSSILAWLMLIVICGTAVYIQFFVKNWSSVARWFGVATLWMFLSRGFFEIIYCGDLLSNACALTLIWTSLFFIAPVAYIKICGDKIRLKNIQLALYLTGATGILLPVLFIQLTKISTSVC